MKKMTSFILCTLTICTLLTSTSIAQTMTEKKSAVVFEEVQLTDSVTLEDGGVKTELKSVSYGIRKKKVFLLAVVKIYVAEFFAAEPSKLRKTSDDILSSLKSAGTIQLRITVSRDLTGTQISESFKEALKANGVDSENTSQELTQILTTLNEFKQFKTGDVFSLTATWKDKMATMYLQKPGQPLQKITGPEKFATDLFSIWFGIPADPKLEDLKKSLLK